MTWTVQHDAGIAFGAALGMTTAQIGNALGKPRNAVIGRAHRQKIDLCGNSGKRRWRPRAPIKVERQPRADGIDPLGRAARAAGLTVADLLAMRKVQHDAG